jgi:L-ascorbate metabolism protein UlaG (beta-lactamase superfamily)
MLGPRGPNAFVSPKHPSTGQPNASIARYLAPAAYSLDGLDAILISHTHNDHVDARAKELLPKSLPVVVAAAGAQAMRGAGFSDVRGLDWGESTTLTAGETTLRVLAVAAHHAHDPDLDREVGKGNGYLLEWKDAAGSYRIYWTGDAVLSDETKDFVAQYGRVDLLLPHMAGVGGDGDRGLRTQLPSDDWTQLRAPAQASPPVLDAPAPTYSARLDRIRCRPRKLTRIHGRLLRPALRAFTVAHGAGKL